MKKIIFWKKLKVLPALTAMLLFAWGNIANAQYCVPSGDCSWGDEIDNFYTTGGIQNISNLNSGCSPNDYGDFTATHTLEVSPGSTFDIAVQTSGAYAQGFTIWIDWNQDGDFDDPGEEVWNSGTSGTQEFTGTITVPATAIPGATRMRVRCDYVSVPTDPCATQSYGETEDYTIIVSSGTATDTETIGTGTLSSYFYGPIYRSSAASSFDYSNYVYLYSAAELSGIPAGATITGVEWEKADSDGMTGNNFLEILMENTTQSSIAVSGNNYTAETTTSTTVFSDNNYTIPASTGWHMHNLDVPFVYTGGNLKIAVGHEKNGTATGGINYYYENHTGMGGGTASSSPTTTSTFSTSYSDRRPNIRITYQLAGISCFPPMNLAASNPTGTTVDLDWTDTSATEWQVEWGTIGFTQGTGTSAITTSKPYTITGLSGLTDYDFYVRSICAAGDTSMWMGPVTERTLFQCPAEAFCFTNAGATGSVGPTQAQLDAEYGGRPLAQSVNGYQEWLVPQTGEYKISVYGAEGGGENLSHRGQGGSASGHVTLNGGETVYITVGQAGQYGHTAPAAPPGGFGGGGDGGSAQLNDYHGSSGGGASDVRIGDTTLASRVIVAAGGGGGTGDGAQAWRGGGGGGGGGGYYGGGGGHGGDQSPYNPGYGGTQTAGGTGGGTLSGNTDGGLGYGGHGGHTDYTSTFTSNTNQYGGDGGGLTGQDGNDGGSSSRANGGGGGSSYYGGLPAYTLTNTSTQTGIREGHGLVVIEPQFSIQYAQNDAGVASIDEPDVYCPGANDVIVTIGNFGGNQITSVDVHWTVNGAPQTAVTYTGTLDTLGGAGNITDQVNLGSYTFTNAAYEIVAWTTNPNGQTDTVNVNDTAYATVQSSLPEPTNLALTDSTGTTATFSWTGGSPANSWMYVVVDHGQPLILGDIVHVTSETATATGLSPFTQYDVYVAELCPGYADTSDWAGPLTFTTATEFGPGTLFFTNAGATGAHGPTQAEINAEYTGTNLDGLVTTAPLGSGIQQWTVPATGLYTISAYGAEGGGDPGNNAPPGLGAMMSGDFTLNNGDILWILVGQEGVGVSSSSGGTGGGGSFVTTNDTTPLVVAAGGSGAPNSTNFGELNGKITNRGPYGGGGHPTSASGGGGGGGFLTDGTSADPAMDGKAFINGGAGGIGSSGDGGFGGGGGKGGTFNDGAGGGGYSGGDNTYDAVEYGGGGSYNVGTNQNNMEGANSGHGYVIIEEIVPPTCPEPTNLTATALTTTSVELAWTTGGASNWMIAYGKPGDAPGEGTIIHTSSNPHTLTGLDPLNDYYYYVQDSCGAGDKSTWAGPFHFFTLPEMCGTYTIGDGATDDFNSFNDALNAAEMAGVSCPVTFEVANGTYDENLNIQTISGASSANTITFTSASGDSTSVILEHSLSSTSDAVIMFDGAEHITFSHMTIQTQTGSNTGRVIQFDNGAHHNQLLNNVIASEVSTSSNFSGIYTTGSNDNYNVIKNNHIKNGYYGIYWRGASTSARQIAGVIENNIIDNWHYYGIYTYYNDSLQINNNYMTPAQTSGIKYGVYAYYTYHHFTIANNQVYIDNPSNSSTQYGFRIYYGNYYLQADPSYGPGMVYNNVTSINTGGTKYGMYLYYNDNTQYYHNSFYLTGGGSTVRPLYQNNTSSNTVGEIFANNIYVEDVGNYAAYILGGSNITSSDHNIYYSPGTNLAYWGSNQATLSDLQTASGMEANSMDVNPVFASIADLTPISDVADDMGTPIAGITHDVFGNPRDPVTPDVGAIEFTGYPDDLAITDAYLTSGECLSANDSLYITIYNILGSTVDFSTNALTIQWDVTGPKNSSGTYLLNSGTLDMDSSMTIGTDGVDMSKPGDYTLSAWIEPNADNPVAVNDSLLDHYTHTILNPFYVEPNEAYVYSPVDTVELSARSKFFPGGDFLITEICHYKYSVGEPVGGWPTYLIADDYIEITGVPNSDLNGYTLEQWQSSMDGTYTFPPGTILSPNGTAVIAVGQLGSSVEDPANFYYHGNGTFTGLYSSTTSAGRILKDPSGNIVDAVGYNGYTFPAAANVPASEWSNPLSGGGSTSGIRLIGPDDNTGNNWVVSSSTYPQDPNSVNSGVTVPTPGVLTGFEWSLFGVPVATSVDTVVGPFTTNATYHFVASYLTVCGLIHDTVTVHVEMPTATATHATMSSCSPGDTVMIPVELTGTGPWTIEGNDGTNTMVIDNITTSPHYIPVTPTTTTTYQVTEVQDANGWNYSMATTVVEVHDPPVISATATPDTVAHGTSTQLDVAVTPAAGTYSYAWSPADSLANPANFDQANPMTKNLHAPMAFTVTVTDVATSCYATDQVHIHITGGPLGGSVTANRDSVCPGDTTQLFTTAYGGSESYTYSWSSSPAGFSSSDPNPIVTVNEATTYTVTIDDGFSTIQHDVTVGNFTKPTITLSTATGPLYEECQGPDMLSAIPAGGTFSGTGVSADEFNPTIAGLGVHTVSYEYTDINGCVSIETMNLTVNPDTTPPTVVTQDITVALDAAGNATITPAQIDNGSYDNCAVDHISLDITSFSCTDVGTNTVTLTVTDVNNNSATGTAQVTVEDNTPPVIAVFPAPVFLDATGNATITAADVDNGTSDNCGINSISISQTSFTCADLGPNVLTFTAEDVNSNISTAPVTVTVYDTIAPVVNTQDITVYLNAMGVATISAADIDNGSTDNCNILTMSLDNNTFSCSHLGANTVTLTVTDQSLNSASATATVTVEDTILPSVNTQDVTVYLDAAGQASVTAAQIDNGSTDNCGIDNISLDITNFTCADLGANTVTLTVTDLDNNSATGTATVTVLDTIAPVISQLPDTTVCAGPFYFTMPTATDNCGVIVEQVAGPDTGDVLTPGVYTFTFVATDDAGNTATSGFTATVTEPHLDLGDDSTICHNHYITLSVDDGYENYLWSTGDTTHSISLYGDDLGANATHTIWVTVTDSMGCTSSDTILITVDDCTGIHEFTSQGEINIYPNPNKGEFNMEIQGIADKTVNVCVFNANGQKVTCEEMERNFQNGYFHTFDLTNQPKGVYLIRVSGNTTLKTERIIIQ